MKELKSYLQIYLITYNRKKTLQRTLEKILAKNSPVRECAITVLDNCSTDGSSELIDSFKRRYPNLIHIRHPHNIGGNANAAYAYSHSTAEYIWVLCDDDEFDFSGWSEALRCMEAHVPLICASNFYNISPADQALILMQLSFIPSIILHTSVLTSTVLKNMYDSVYTMFPQMALISAVLNSQKEKICLLSRPLVHCGEIVPSYCRGVEVAELSPLGARMSWALGYSLALQSVKNRALAKKSLRKGINIIYLGFEDFINEMKYLYSAPSFWGYAFEIMRSLPFCWGCYFAFRFLLGLNPLLDFYIKPRGFYLSVFYKIKFKVIPFGFHQ